MEENFKNKNPFKTPQHYFDKLENKLLDNTKIIEDDMNAFKIPNDYFLDLEKKILEKNNYQKKKYKNRYLWLAVSSVAASVILCLFFLGSIKSFFTTNEIKNEVVIDKKSENEIYKSLYNSYFVEEKESKTINSDFSLDDFEEYYAEVEISKK